MYEFKVNKSSPIIRVIKEKARITKRTTLELGRLLVLVGGGGTASAYSAGILRGFENYGLSKAFDIAVGISGGAINLAFFLAGQANFLESVYCKDFAHCVNPTRPWNVYDFQRIESVIRKKLNVDSIIQQPTEFYAAVTSLNGEGKLLNVKNTEDSVNLLMASSTPPLSYNSAVRIGSEDYFDGEIGMPMPLKEVAEVFDPTYVLIILNRPHDRFSPRVPYWQRFFISFALCFYAPSLWSKFLTWSSSYKNSMDFVEILSNWVNIGIISPPHATSETCNSPKELERIMQSADLFVSELLT